VLNIREVVGFIIEIILFWEKRIESDFLKKNVSTLKHYATATYGKNMIFLERVSMT